MARVRTLANLRDDARKRADVEAEDDRHPDSDVTRYVNEGGAALRDLLIEVKGRTYFRKATPQTITTTSATRYTLNTDFYRLISVRLGGVAGDMLDPFSPQDEVVLRAPGVTATYPTHYELQPDTIELLPVSQSGSSVIVEYIPAYTDLVADDDTLLGYNGWEDYVVAYAAIRILTKDDEQEQLRTVAGDLKALETRIRALAPKRDAFRAEKVKDVRSIGGRYRW